MSKLNPQNERIKRDYLRHLKQACGKSEATLDATRKALARFEDYTGARDFKTFRREQAIGFKERLSETGGQRTGEPLSHSTQASTLAALKEFQVALLATRFQVQDPRSRHRLFQPINQGQCQGEGS
jgi:site-specific recombinase XerD